MCFDLAGHIVGKGLCFLQALSRRLVLRIEGPLGDDDAACLELLAHQVERVLREPGRREEDCASHHVAVERPYEGDKPLVEAIGIESASDKEDIGVAGELCLRSVDRDGRYAELLCDSLCEKTGIAGTGTVADCSLHEILLAELTDIYCAQYIYEVIRQSGTNMWNMNMDEA